MSALDAGVLRALDCVREWTSINGRLDLDADEVPEFRDQLEDAIRGIER